MTILLLDDDYITIEQLNCLTQLNKGWKTVQYNEISYNKIDLVIIDIFNKKYNTILEEILISNPNIRTIIVSDKLANNLSQGCEYCSSNYNRIRLIKPIKLKDLFNTINEFDTIPFCPLIDTFKSLETLLPLIVDSFKDLLYDKESQIISSISDSESKEHTMQILSLLTILDQNKIQYTLLDENSIKIHM